MDAGFEAAMRLGVFHTDQQSVEHAPIRPDLRRRRPLEMGGARARMERHLLLEQVFGRRAAENDEAVIIGALAIAAFDILARVTENSVRRNIDGEFGTGETPMRRIDALVAEPAENHESARFRNRKMFDAAGKAHQLPAMEGQAAFVDAMSQEMMVGVAVTSRRDALAHVGILLEIGLFVEFWKCHFEH